MDEQAVRSEAMAVVRGIFELPECREKKCETLYGLARRTGGTIIELGTYHGNGAVSMALGLRDRHGGGGHIYTVDDYRKKKGWATEEYLPKDEAIFKANIERAGVAALITLVRKEAFVACQEWPEGMRANLIFWDLGINGRMRRDFGCWQRHLIVGGIYAIHDTLNRRLGSKGLTKELVASGKWMDGGFQPGGVQVLVKRERV